MSSSYLLGVDIGTYSSKGVLVDLQGNVIASHVILHKMSMPEAGHFEHDAVEIWWHDFVVICKNILTASKIDPKDILGIGTSGIGACVLPVDKEGKPLRPAILYGIDTRATQEIDQLNQYIGEENIYARNGSYLSSQACGPKMLWIRNHEPEVFNRTHKFLTSEAFLVFKLTRKFSIDILTASDYNPFFDLEKKEWIKEYCELAAPPETLPELYWSCDVVGKVTKEAAQITGLSEGTPVIAGTTDSPAEAISAGLALDGDLMIMFGSSVFFILKTSKLARTKKFWFSNDLEPGSFAFQGGMSTAGSLTHWFREQFGQPEVKQEKATGVNAYTALAELAASSPPGANGLIALPYFEGERTPIHDPYARGAFFGLSLKHTRADMLRALLESVAFGIRHNLEAMHAEGIHAKRILAVGGGTKNKPWMQAVCDAASIEMFIPEQQIGASYGDAFMAGVGIGAFSDLSEVSAWVTYKDIIKPDPKTKAIYDRNYMIYRKLYEQSAHLMHWLNSRKTRE